jgi:hypothetical protein
MMTLDDIHAEERPVKTLKVYGVMAFTGNLIGIDSDDPEFTDVYVAARVEGELAIIHLDEEARREYDPGEETLGVYEAGIVFTNGFFTFEGEECTVYSVEIEFGRGFWRLRPIGSVESLPRGSLDADDDDEPEETEE